MNYDTPKEVQKLIRVIDGRDHVTGNIIRVCAVDQCGLAVDRRQAMIRHLEIAAAVYSEKAVQHS